MRDAKRGIGKSPPAWYHLSAQHRRKYESLAWTTGSNAFRQAVFQRCQFCLVYAPIDIHTAYNAHGTKMISADIEDRP